MKKNVSQEAFRRFLLIGQLLTDNFFDSNGELIIPEIDEGNEIWQSAMNWQKECRENE